LLGARSGDGLAAYLEWHLDPPREIDDIDDLWPPGTGFTALL
jgi:hypothetical protein